MKITPTRGHLIGQIIDGDYKTASGIYVVDSLKKKKPRSVRIVSHGGPMENEEKYRAETGQTAYFKLNAGHATTINGQDCLILKNSDIVATAGEI